MAWWGNAQCVFSRVNRSRPYLHHTNRMENFTNFHNLLAKRKGWSLCICAIHFFSGILSYTVSALRKQSAPVWLQNVTFDGYNGPALVSSISGYLEQSVHTAFDEWRSITGSDSDQCSPGIEHISAAQNNGFPFTVNWTCKVQNYRICLYMRLAEKFSAT